MSSEISERIRACIAVETNIADIYHSFSMLFPEERTFWHALAKEEENHASIMIIAGGFDRLGKLPEHAVPCSFPMIQESLDMSRDIQDQIKRGNVSLEEALQMALTLENTIVESYFQEVLTDKTDSPYIEKLKILLSDTRSHVEKIKDVMLQRGYTG